MSTAYTLKNNGSIVLFHSGKSYVIDKSHINYTKIVDALKTKQFTELSDLIDIKQYLVKKSYGVINISTEDEVLYNGKPLHNAMSERLLYLIHENWDVIGFVKFMENTLANPDPNARDDLYTFIEACDLPITPEGNFLAYKYVTADFKDCRTRTFDNSVGKTVSMPREECNSNRNETCSSGLHVCSLKYLGDYGSGYFTASSPVIVCEVNPKNVVAVPIEYNMAKMRTCEYNVIGVLQGAERIKAGYVDKKDNFVAGSPANSTVFLLPDFKAWLKEELEIDYDSVPDDASLEDIENDYLDEYADLIQFIYDSNAPTLDDSSDDDLTMFIENIHPTANFKQSVIRILNCYEALVDGYGEEELEIDYEEDEPEEEFADDNSRPFTSDANYSNKIAELKDSLRWALHDKNGKSLGEYAGRENARAVKRSTPNSKIYDNQNKVYVS